MSRDAYICEGKRTPIGRYGGALSSVRPDDMAAHVIRQVMTEAKDLAAGSIDDTVFGCANQAGEDNRNVARMATLLAGLPIEVSGGTVNRLCGSGLDAIGISARAIRAGEADVMLAGGVESMSRAPFVMPKAQTAFARDNTVYDTTIGWRFVNKMMKEQYGIDSMPETAENVAEEFQVSRADQDAFAIAQPGAGGGGPGQWPPRQGNRAGDDPAAQRRSHRCRQGRASAPDDIGETGSALPTPFRKDGSVTPGNASGVNDGAAAVIVASGEAVEKYGLTPKARVLGTATAGVSPHIMGIGPAPASEKLLRASRSSRSAMSMSLS